MLRKQKAAAGQKSRVHLDPLISADAAASLSTNASGSGHLSVAHRNADSLAPIIAEIRSYHRDRVFAMEMRKRADLALGAFIRRGMGWSRNLPKVESEAIKKAASDLVALGEKIFAGKATGIGNAQWSMFGAIIIASIHGRIGFTDIEKGAVADMERLARLLPVWDAFGKNIKGFGPRSLAVIVAETGDLWLYANPGKVWKRMGLAPIKKGDHTKAGSTWRLKGGLSKEDWAAAGDSPHRRSFMFVIGDVLIKNQNAYRDVYLERKEVERAKAKAAGLTVAPAAKIPEKRKHEFMSDGHVHRRAQRYMEKRLLKHLWQAWRRAFGDEITKSGVPAATSSAQAERSAIQPASTKHLLPSAERSQTKLAVQTTQPVSGKRPKIIETSKSSLPSAPIQVKAGKRRAIECAVPESVVPAADIRSAP